MDKSTMKTTLVIVLCLLLSANVSTPLAAQHGVTAEAIDKKSFNPATVIWLSKPATKWEEALPVGNGRLGAMIYGGVHESIIQLNEETYWSGGPYSTIKKGGHEKLKEIQQLVFEEKMLQAHNLFGRHLMGYPVEQQKYQSLANLHLQFDFKKEYTQYKRWLDLETGISAVDFSVDGTRYHQEIFSSHPDQVIVMRIEADVPGSVSFSANLRGVRNQAHSNYGTDYFEMNGWNADGLMLSGKSADYLGVEGKLRYDARIKVIPEGGTVSVDGYMLQVSQANAVTIYIAAATNFVKYNDVSANEHLRTEQYFKNISHKTYAAIKADHVKNFQHLFARTSLSLQGNEHSFLPTDERMISIQTSPDAQLAALCYQFGRYVLISSSRPGTEPANLQGIWNNDMNPAWDSKYTTNINTEMNYWAAESANLAECAEPLFRMVKELTDQGTKVAREHYGAKGWVFHQNTDLWRVAAPMDGPTWGTFTVGGAWLVNELWEHYRFTQDEKFLQELYPIMKGSVEFFMDFLIPHPNGKWLVTNPSTSPENFPKSPGNHRYFDEVTGSMIPGTTICAGSSIDMQILMDLFSNYAHATELLTTDLEFGKRVTDARRKLVPPQIGKDGSLQEWADDWGQLEENHRHFSHLYGLYPGNVLSPRKTPEFMTGCKAVLEQRGDGGAGWSRAWKVALWGRLGDGNRANKIFKGYLKEQAYPQLFAKCFTPLQVDGTLGMTAGISELLIQSHEGYIQLLPALPDEWKDGTFKGVCTRDGFELEFTWAEGKVKRISVLSRQGKPFRLRIDSPMKVTTNGAVVKIKKTELGILEYDTKKNQRYQLLEK
ncbi:MAG: glycoside hydrolase family 95 protein [Cyclobacteriaceae bacterium]|nr:glycoside hydrolase family 95 protein [Cyclobacteriaceae bacterium]